MCATVWPLTELISTATKYSLINASPSVCMCAIRHWTGGLGVGFDTDRGGEGGWLDTDHGGGGVTAQNDIFKVFN